MMRQATASLASLLFLSACMNGATGFRPLTYAEPGETRTLVSYTDCESYKPNQQQFAPAMLAAVAIGAASKVLENFGTSLSNAAAGGELPATSGTANFETTVGRVPQCIMIIRGEFAPANSTDGNPVEGKWVVPDSNSPTGLSNQTLPKVVKLQHRIELQIIQSQDKSALLMQPVYAKIAQSTDGETEAGKSRDLSIALAFARPGKKDVGSVVVLSNQKIGTAFTYDAKNMSPSQSPWFASFTAPAKQGDTPSATPIPVTAKTTVVETRPSRAFLAFVASIFNDVAKPAINTALKNEFDADTIETNTKSDLDASAAYATAYGTAIAARSTYCALDVNAASNEAERAKASAAARSAQIKANKAAIDADLEPPFDDGELIEVTGAAFTCN